MSAARAIRTGLLGLTLLALPTRAQAQDERWRTLADGQSPALRYVVVAPDDLDPRVPRPVLLALPPGGQDAAMVERGLELYFEAEARRRGWIVVSPAAPEGQSLVEGTEARLLALLDALARELAIEGGAVHLAGVSNGGRAAVHLAGLHPERFRSLTVLPGAPAGPEDEERLARLAPLPVTMFVGAEDEPWREASLRMAEALEAAGAQDVLLVEREGEGHVLDAAVAALVFERLESLRRPSRGSHEQRFFDWTRLQFPAEVHAKRRARLVETLRPDGPGIFLAPGAEGVSQGATFRQRDDFLYFTGLELPRSVLAIDVASGTATVYAPERDARFENAGRPNDFPGRPLAADPELGRRAGLAVLPWERFAQDLARWAEDGTALWLDRIPAEDHAEPFALRDEHAALAAHLRERGLSDRLRDASAAVARLRMVKGPEEIERIRRACLVTADGIRAAAKEVRPGVDERTLEGVLEAAFKRGGAQRPAFDSIVKSGPNSLWPWRILAAHSDRRNRALASGELVIFDVGCELDHYASDVGRTFPVTGRFTPEQARRLRMVTAVSDAILAAVRPGTTLPELRKIAEAALPEDERRHMQTGSFFGHHVGLDVGDPSLLEAPLVPGMVFTVEPWYYDHEDGVALFVEDVVLVTADGAENLTAGLPRSVEGLEELVGAH